MTGTNLIIFTLFMGFARGLATTQYLTYYQGVNCTGRNDTNFYTRDDLNETWIGDAQSVEILGPWRQTLYRPGALSWSGVTVTYRNAQPQNKLCVNRQEMINYPEDYRNFRFYFADRVGPASLRPSMVLSTETSFKGVRYNVAREDNGTYIPRPMMIKSIVVFGGNSWLLYPHSNFGGEAKCLCPSHTGGDGFTLIEPTEIIVGSWKPVGPMDQCTCGSITEPPVSTTTSTTRRPMTTTRITTTTSRYPLPHLKYFEGLNCTGRNETILSSDYSLNSTWIGMNASSVEIVGLWKLTLSTQGGNETEYINREAQPYPYPPLCKNKQDMIPEPKSNNEYAFYSAVNYIPRFDWPRVLMTTLQQFSGEQFEIGGGNVGQSPLRIQSLAIVGESHWLLYPQASQRGEPICLSPTYKFFTVVEPIDIVVGSVRTLSGSLTCSIWNTTTTSIVSSSTTSRSSSTLSESTSTTRRPVVSSTPTSSTNLPSTTAAANFLRNGSFVTLAIYCLLTQAN